MTILETFEEVITATEVPVGEDVEIYLESITATEVPISTGLEILVGMQPVLVEVHEPLPDTTTQIGGPDPTANPNILVWYDTQGA